MGLFKVTHKYQVRGFDPKTRSLVGEKNQITTNSLKEAHNAARDMLLKGFYGVAVHYTKKTYVLGKYNKL